MEVFHALADPQRRRVLDLLKGHELSAGELAGSFDISWPALSQHLGVLKRAGLVRERREGRFRFYSVDAAPLANECLPWLNDHVRFWKTKLRDLKKYLEEEET